MFNISLNPYKSYTDEELIVAYKESGNSKYIGELYKRYNHLIMGVALKYFKNHDEAQDIVMEVFELVLQKLLKSEVKVFKGWLYILTKNHIMGKFRNKMLKNTEYTDTFMENENDEHLLYDSEIEMPYEQLEKGLQSLNEQQQICIKQFYLEDKSYKEISDGTGWDINAVKSFIQNGKRNLKIFLQKQNVHV
jgi:RNA polymerase sigma-70 factor (ECF subfamily)